MGWNPETRGTDGEYDVDLYCAMKREPTGRFKDPEWMRWLLAHIVGFHGVDPSRLGSPAPSGIRDPKTPEAQAPCTKTL